jgi:hypothetical protein
MVWATTSWAIFSQTHGVDVMIAIFRDFCLLSAKKMAFFSKTML